MKLVLLSILLISMSLKAQRDIPGIPIKQILESQKKTTQNSKKTDSKKTPNKNMKTRPKKEETHDLSKSKTI